MNTPNPVSARTRHHPLLLIAALAVILFCAVGTAAIMGWLPSSRGGNTGQLNDADRAALSAGMQPGASDMNYAAAQPPAAGLPGQPALAATAPAAPLPGQPLAPVRTAPASAYAPATAYAPTPANQGAYGDSGNQGATGSGADYPAASGVAYASDQAARDARAERKPVKLADNAGDSRWCSNCGNVESIHEITTRARGSGVGAGAGAILGGLLGNQVGSGNGRSLATVAGAVGGAVMGNQVEGNMHAYQSYEIRVRLDDGSLRTFHQRSAPAWRTGDRVRIVKGALHTA